MHTHKRLDTQNSSSRKNRRRAGGLPPPLKTGGQRRPRPLPAAASLAAKKKESSLFFVVVVLWTQHTKSARKTRVKLLPLLLLAGESKSKNNTSARAPNSCCCCCDCHCRWFLRNRPPVASAGWRRHGVGVPQQQLPLQLLQWQRPQASVAAAIALAHVETPKTTAGKRRQKKTTKSLPSPHRHTNRVEVSPHTLQKPQNKGFANMRSPSSSPKKPVRSICCVLCVGG